MSDGERLWPDNVDSLHAESSWEGSRMEGQNCSHYDTRYDLDVKAGLLGAWPCEANAHGDLYIAHREKTLTPDESAMVRDVMRRLVIAAGFRSIKNACAKMRVTVRSQAGTRDLSNTCQATGGTVVTSLDDVFSTLQQIADRVPAESPAEPSPHASPNRGPCCVSPDPDGCIGVDPCL
jgi:hypothetical protein